MRSRAERRTLLSIPIIGLVLIGVKFAALSTPSAVATVPPMHVHPLPTLGHSVARGVVKATETPPTISVKGVTVTLPVSGSTTVQLFAGNSSLPLVRLPAPVNDGDSTNTRDWNCIRRFESSGGVGNGNYASSGLEPFGGAYQFSVSTWQGLGFPGVPNQAPAWEQDEAALAEYWTDLKATGNPFSAWQTASLCGL